MSGIGPTQKDEIKLTLQNLEEKWSKPEEPVKNKKSLSKVKNFKQKQDKPHFDTVKVISN